MSLNLFSVSAPPFRATTLARSPVSNSASGVIRSFISFMVVPSLGLPSVKGGPAAETTRPFGKPS
jgi:hypothetical protein